jgi:CubicO group peptidase (beta-lactamase class C family)
MPLVDSTRRSLLIGAGLTAASALVMTRRGHAASEATRGTLTSDILLLIDQERARIQSVMKKDAVPGAALCLLYEGKAVWVEGLGVTDLKSDRRIGPGTIFSIQSTSKNFTATAIMLAVQRGLLQLDEPITVYLPEFRVRSRFESAPQEKMTLRLLLGHRAGFTHEAPVGNNYDPAFPDFEAHIRSISETWLRHPVGERYRYSNLGIDLAGYVLQRAAGRPFAECLKTMIFDPLGMGDSTAETGDYARRADRAVGHEKGYATVPLKTPLIPSGGVYTSARDMIGYLAFHLGRGTFGGKALLQRSLWEEMHGFSLGGDYGLGIIRAELRYGDTPVRMLGHKGGGFGFGCVCNYCPDAQLAWVALFNRPAAAPYQFGAELLDNLLVRRYGPRRPRLPAADLSPIRLERPQLEAFTGNYVGRAAAVQIKLADGVLGMQAGATFTPLRFTSPVDLFAVGVDGDTLTYRYFAEIPGEAAHLECASGENSLDYNDGPSDSAGPNLAAWESYIGRFVIDQWGKHSDEFSVHRKNGYLYLNELRLIIETEPGLFFAADGEALDLRYAAPTWRNLRLRRISDTAAPV